MAEVEPLEEIEVVGKRLRKDEPFPVSRQRGLYFFIQTELFNRLKEINEAYKAMPQADVRSLEKIKIVGRGGVEGYMPFLLPGYSGTYVCILAEHLKQLEEINRTYGAVLEVKRAERRREELEQRAETEALKRAEEAEILVGERPSEGGEIRLLHNPLGGGPQRALLRGAGHRGQQRGVHHTLR